MKLCLALLPALFCVSLSAFADDDKPTINVDLQTRLEEIIIPEINFEGIELQTALQDIMKASIQNDPAEV